MKTTRFVAALSVVLCGCHGNQKLADPIPAVATAPEPELQHVIITLDAESCRVANLQWLDWLNMWDVLESPHDLEILLPNGHIHAQAVFSHIYWRQPMFIVFRPEYHAPSFAQLARHLRAQLTAWGIPPTGQAADDFELWEKSTGQRKRCLSPFL